MKEYQLRVVEEKKDLDEKAENLWEFITNSPVFDTIDEEEQILLMSQNKYMWLYSQVLAERIEAFDDNLE